MIKKTQPVFIQLLIILLALIAPLITHAQEDEYELGQKLKYLDLGIKQYESGMYEDADKSFRQVLETVNVLPAEICFYFGANSYYLKKFKQSINWLNKYIALKGTSGQFFEESTQLLKEAEENYLLATSKNDSEVFNPEANTDYTVMPKVDCGPSGKVVCPVCKGQTVIIKKTAMSFEYKTCPYCDEHGNLTCEEYNQLLLGELKPKSERSLN